MTTALVAIGAVMAFEGLVFALAPHRLEDVLALIARMPLDLRRLVGLGTLATGVAILWLSRLFAG